MTDRGVIILYPIQILIQPIFAVSKTLSIMKVLLELDVAFARDLIKNCRNHNKRNILYGLDIKMYSITFYIIYRMWNGLYYIIMMEVKAA